jgi:ferric-dicitrate binding protein FerR (iron transport regulator)
LRELAIAATVLTVFAGVMLIARFSTTKAVHAVFVASIAKLQGSALAGGVQVSTTKGNTWRDAIEGERLNADMLLRTDAATSIALEFVSGLSVRMDRSSLLQLSAANRTVLERGRVYVDADSPERAPFVIETRFGALEHVGTQYQASVTTEKLTVSVREGRIAISRERVKTGAIAGERVEIGAAGELNRTEVSPQDPEWQWAIQAAPTFEIDNRSLASFLDWVARETGRTVRYARPEIRMQAEKLLLRGSIANLTPEQALNAVMATTEFTHATGTTAIEIGRQ